MTPKIWPLLERCIEDGLVFGWNRAHKYEDTPGPDAIRDAQLQAILHEIAEWFDFEDAYGATNDAVTQIPCHSRDDDNLP